MLCPFCLQDVTFEKKSVTGTAPAGVPRDVFTCPKDKMEVPTQYEREYLSYPPVVINAVGYRGHGKTVYLASLFHVLKRSTLPDHWPRFFTMGLAEEDLNTIYRNMNLFDKGELPDATPKNFPRPTMIRVEGVPGQRNCTWLCFDTGGECFEKPTQLVQYAGFVSRARSVLFLISLCDLPSPAQEMSRLLNVYVIGLQQLEGRTEDQDLVVVYTKADELSWDGEWGDLGEYLARGTVDRLARDSGYIGRLNWVSERLKQFTQKGLKASEFLNAARKNFKSVEFCLVSSLGAKPEGKRLSVCISPKRVLDPMLWVMEKSRPGWLQSLRRWFL